MKAFKTKNLKQVVTFKARPHDLYEMIIDSKKHAQFSGAKAKMTKKIGGRFNAYGGWISGTNLKLIPDKLIVQEWRGKNWPQDHFSNVMFLFTKTATGTTLTFSQTSIPADTYVHISKGWKEQYWDKMKVQLGEKKPSAKKTAM